MMVAMTTGGITYTLLTNTRQRVAAEFRPALHQFSTLLGIVLYFVFLVCYLSLHYQYIFVMFSYAILYLFY